MHSIQVKEEDIQHFYEVILQLKSPEDCRDLFDDLCTVNELRQMVQRVKAAELLLQDKTYNQVIAETDISSATLSRVSRCVQYGKGYSRILPRLQQDCRQ